MIHPIITFIIGAFLGANLGVLIMALVVRRRGITALQAQVALEDHPRTCYGCHCGVECSEWNELREEAVRLREEALGKGDDGKNTI